MKMECPKNYGSFDISIRDCPDCKQGFLYQTCTMSDKKHSACAGWVSETGPKCCKHYQDEVDMNHAAYILRTEAEKIGICPICGAFNGSHPKSGHNHS